MKTEISNLIDNLNNPDAAVRIKSLGQLIEEAKAGKIEEPRKGQDVNNHIHTTFSFSPYTPAKAIWMAYNAGLSTAGIVDHDTIGGAAEFILAGKITGIATTIGVECRADFSKTALNRRRINNPDQNSIAYVILHGIPHTQLDCVKEFFKPYSEYRNIRNRLMLEKLNEIIGTACLHVDFGKDVIPVSNYKNGGSITERHILYALSLKLVDTFGKGGKLAAFLTEKLKLNADARKEQYLKDSSNPYYEYDLLGLLKSELVGSFYIDAALECPDVRDIINFADAIGAISAYAYLGDVENSVTGDKRTQKFEDGYIEELFSVIYSLGFHAVTYAPSRNSIEQLERVQSLCARYGFFQISGEDINSPRQSFICEALQNKKFSNLYDSTWALIGHESAASAEPGAGMFSPALVEKFPGLEERIRLFKEIGLSLKSQNKKS